MILSGIKKEGIWFLFVLFVLFMLILPEPCHAAIAAPGGEVENMKELNAALGGIHKLDGNTIRLKDDIILQKEVIMRDFKSNVTILSNGKTVQAGKHVDACFWVDKTNVRFKGKGTYLTTDPYAHCISGSAPCTITIDGGEFDPGANKVKIQLFGGSIPSDRARVVINDGNFESGIAVYNGDRYLWEEHDYEVSKPAVDLTVKKGIISSPIILDKPWKYNDDSEFTPEYDNGSNSIKIHNGTLSEILCNDTISRIYGGTIKRMQCAYESKLYLNGGRIGRCSVTDNSNLVMKNITFFPRLAEKVYDDQCLLIRDSQAVINGGTFREDAADNLAFRYGLTYPCIRIQGKSKVRITGISMDGAVYTKVPKSHKYTGILLQGTSKFQPVLTLQAVKGRTIQVNNYKEAIACSSKYCSVKLKKNTILELSGNKNTKYSSSDKLPDILKGDIVVSY